MDIAKEIFAWTFNFLLVAVTIATCFIVTLAPFLIIMGSFPPGHGGAVVLMVFWGFCLFLSFMYWITSW